MVEDIEEEAEHDRAVLDVTRRRRALRGVLRREGHDGARSAAKVSAGRHSHADTRFNQALARLPRVTQRIFHLRWVNTSWYWLVGLTNEKAFEKAGASRKP